MVVSEKLTPAVRAEEARNSGGWGAGEADEEEEKEEEVGDWIGRISPVRVYEETAARIWVPGVEVMVWWPLWDISVVRWVRRMWQTLRGPVNRCPPSLGLTQNCPGHSVRWG